MKSDFHLPYQSTESVDFSSTLNFIPREILDCHRTLAKMIDGGIILRNNNKNTTMSFIHSHRNEIYEGVFVQTEYFLQHLAKGISRRSFITMSRQFSGRVQTMTFSAFSFGIQIK